MGRRANPAKECSYCLRRPHNSRLLVSPILQTQPLAKRLAKLARIASMVREVNTVNKIHHQATRETFWTMLVVMSGRNRYCSRVSELRCRATHDQAELEMETVPKLACGAAETTEPNRSTHRGTTLRTEPVLLRDTERI